MNIFMVDIKLIDPDDVQFDGYKSLAMSYLILPSFSKEDLISVILSGSIWVYY